jgi:putative DNA primase/helicase
MINPIEQFRDAIAAVGLRTHDDIIPDGKIHRFHVEGDKPKAKNGWYVLHSDGVPAGSFGSWKHDVASTWCSKSEHEFTQEERREYARRMDDARKQREAEQERLRAEARERAFQIWESIQPATDDHPYLVRKGVRAHNVRISRGSLVIPVKDINGTLHSLQFIDADGNKLFLKHGRKEGCYSGIGKPNGKIYIAEGYATAATIHEASGDAVAIAFDAGNLKPVAQSLRERFPDIEIVFAADNDVNTKGNPGLTKATIAANMVGGSVISPPEGDFNDWAASNSIEAVTEIMQAPANNNHEPMDLFAEFPVPPISRDMLPDAIADYAFDSAELIGVVPAMVAMPAIVSCAAALHDGVRIQPKRHESGWTESARLWCAVVGSPSVKKSPAMKRATKRLRKIDMDLHEDNSKDMARFVAENDEYKEAKKAAKKTGEIVTPPQPPVNNRMVVEDITVEALSEILKDNARGVLCIQDELSGWFGSMDAYSGGKAGGKDRAHWLEAYNGGGRVVDRVMRGSLKIPNWSVSMIGGIQPDAIRRIAQNMTDDGLMQRFMIIVGGNMPEQDRPEDSEASKGFADLIDHLYAVGQSNTPVMLTEEAHVVRESLNAFAGELADYPALPGGLKSHLGKWSGLFARLLLIYHAIECAALRRHPCMVQVTEDTAKRVDMLMRNYLLPHAMAYYTDILGAESDLEHARWIAGHILSKRLDVITQRDVLQAYKQWRGLDEWRRVRIMQSLEDMGWLTAVGDDRRSRRGSHTWAVTTSVHQIFAEKAKRETATRDKVRQQIRDMQMAARA